MIKKIKNIFKFLTSSRREKKHPDKAQVMGNTQFYLRYIKIGEEFKYFRIPKN